ncbi:hypothetical protein ACOJBM_01105 [Rhizobium beringeri]
MGSTFFVASLALVFDDVELGASAGAVGTVAGFGVTASIAMHILRLEELINADPGNISPKSWCQFTNYNR